MAKRKNDTNEDSSVLVAIAKLETKLDSLTGVVTELKDGMKSDIEFLKADKIARAEAIRMQTDYMTRHGELQDEIDVLKSTLKIVCDTQITSDTRLKTWGTVGGLVIVAIQLLVAFYK